MVTLPQEIMDQYAKFEADGATLQESDLLQVLASYKDSRDAAGLPMLPEFVAEALAFNLCPECATAADWPTYYGPRFSWGLPEKREPTIPQAGITVEVWTHWVERAQQATHPFMRGRYADLAWDFGSHIPGTSKHNDLARIVVEATKRILDEELYEHEWQVSKSIERAVFVLTKGKLDSGTSSAFKASIERFTSNAQKQASGMWGMRYDFFVASKSNLVESQETAAIIAGMESDLQEAKGKDDHSRAEAVAVRLADYYRRLQQTDDAKRVLKEYARTALAYSQGKHHQIAIQALQPALDRLQGSGLREELDDLVNALRGAYRELNQGMAFHEFKAPGPTLDEVEEFLKWLGDAPDEELLMRILVVFLRHFDELLAAAKSSSEDSVVAKIVQLLQTDSAGDLVAQHGDASDLNPHAKQLLQDLLQIDCYLLRRAFDLVESRIGKESMITQILSGEVFAEDRRPILLRGLTAALEGDHVAAQHFLVPQIEYAFWSVLQAATDKGFSANKSGGFDHKLLDVILREPTLEQLWSPDVLTYLRFVLTDKWGWNFRNNISHGRIPAEGFGWWMTDRLIHILLLLGSLKVTTKDSGPPPTETAEAGL